MKLLMACCLSIFYLNSFAQVDEVEAEYAPESSEQRSDSVQYQTFNKDITLYTAKFQQTVTAINAFVSNSKSSIKSSDKSEITYTLHFVLPISFLAALDSLIDQLGYVSHCLSPSRRHS